MNKYASVEEYISSFPPDTQQILEQIRDTIRQAAPEAEEVISYQMPAYKQKGILVYFAAYKHHIGFYPTGNGILAFADQITAYKSSKGAIQFPIDKAMPLDLITEIVRYRIQQNEEKALAKKK